MINKILACCILWCNSNYATPVRRTTSPASKTTIGDRTPYTPQQAHRLIELFDIDMTIQEVREMADRSFNGNFEACFDWIIMTHQRGGDMSDILYDGDDES